MRCVRAECEFEARQNSVYCDAHRPPDFTMPRFGPTGGASDDDLSVAEELMMYHEWGPDISAKLALCRHDSVVWRDIDQFHCLVEGDQLELCIESKCRAFIDIYPDRHRRIKSVLWDEMTFIPNDATSTRRKVAYYVAREIRRTCEVEFRVRARCRCGGRLGEDELTITVVYLHASDRIYNTGSIG